MSEALFVSNVNNTYSAGAVVNITLNADGSIASATPNFEVGQNYSSILTFNADSGIPSGALVPQGTLTLSSGIAIDGTNLLVNDQGYYNSSSGLYGRVMDFDIYTGQLKDSSFISGDVLTSHGLNFPEDIKIGNNGNIFVSGLGGGGVQEFSGITHQYIKTVASLNSNGQELIAAGLNFGPDGNLYISSVLNDNSILKYDPSKGSTSVLVQPAVAPYVPSGTVISPTTQTLLGSSFLSNGSGIPVQQYNSVTGAPLSDFVGNQNGGMQSASRLIFGSNNDLYISDYDGSQIIRFTEIGGFAPSGSNPGAVFVGSGVQGLSNPGGIAIANVPESSNILGVIVLTIIGAFFKMKVKK
ncbi:MAG: hypothetical protein WCO81_13345 [Cyanobacteriota bacterium ELA615]